jgi:hypothetical protein
VLAPAYRRHLNPPSTAMHLSNCDRRFSTVASGLFSSRCFWHCLSIGLTVLTTEIRGADADEIYRLQIKPLFVEKCISCHGPLEQSGGLRLDAGELIHRGGDSGAVIDMANAGNHTLLERVLATDDQRMPPLGEGTPLDAAEIESLRTWINRGAPYPDDETYAARPEEHWAFQPPVRPELPGLVGDDHSLESHPIDALLMPSRRRAGVRLAERADSETLLRRLTMNLIGLPPAPLQQKSVAESNTDTANGDLQLLVDRLLADPAHAERWARHWMDVWRYSDWYGYKNELRGSQRHIWRWRDWIIDSLAQDKPYDQMIVEMLAADEVTPLDSDRLRGTGFLARNYHPSNRNIWLDATVEHTAKAFLGLTIDCAKCHDHKYDPIQQADYYRFRAIFEPHQTRTDLVAGQADVLIDGLPRAYDADLEAKTLLLVAGDEKRPDETQPIEPLPPQIVGLPMPIEAVALPLWAYVPKLHPEARHTLIAREEAHVSQAQVAYERAEASDGDTASDQVIARLAKHRLDVAQANLESLVARLDADDAKHHGNDQRHDELARHASRLQRQHAAAESELQLEENRNALAAAKAKSFNNDSASQADTKDLEQAEQAVQKAEAARDAALQALTESSTEYTSAVEVYPATSSGRRLALARWITHRDNPLTARVAVNHIWLRHFGRPLVDNVFDFGLRSPRPIHADLLDWLAVELIESGWSTKHIHRLIVTSDVYALGTKLSPHDEAQNYRIDPDHRLYWKFQPVRLEGEAIRDSLLAVAGRIDHQIGGPDIDHQKGETVYRRSLYFRHAYEKQMTMMTTFDGASPSECYRRDASIIPQQALVLANSELTRVVSREVAEQIEAQVRSADLASSCADTSRKSCDDAFIQAAFMRVLGRRPSDAEQQVCRSFLANPFSKPDPVDASVVDAAAEGDNRASVINRDSAGDVFDSDSTGLKARQSLVHALINHNDFVTVR